MSLDVDIRKKLNGFMLHTSFRTDGSDMGILGASGCGKSMTLKCIAGIVKPDWGRITLNGRVLFDSEKRINLTPQKRRVGYLFQHYALFPNMTVYQNIGSGLRLPKEQKEERIREMVKLLDIGGLEERYPSQLSGGQQQRVALARILAYEPDVLLLDEPFSALDFYLKEKLQIQLLEVLHLYGGDVLMVSHSRDEIYRFCKNVIIMDKGGCVTQGNTKELFQNPVYLEAARLTGCKNLSRAAAGPDGTVTALDWQGLVLKGEVPPGEKVRGVGIRAHYFKPGYGEVPKGCNIIPVVEPIVSEGPFEVNVVIHLNKVKQEPEAGGLEAIKSDGDIWWKVDKEVWADLMENQGMPTYLTISPSDVMLLQ